MTILDDTASLARVCNKLGRARYITVDTEFIRDKTYFSRLCLIQVASSEGAWIIDALAPDMDLAPFFELLNRRQTIKVFHAARQDIEIFVHLAGTVPVPLFDTQVAAMVCGFGDAVSYEKLVARLTGAKLDKSQRFTDWSRRPLTRRQTDYALGDVTHLRQVYEALSKRLGDNGRMDWLAEEMDALTSPSSYSIDRRQVWRRLKTRSTNRRFLGIVREIAAWREDEARRRDIPRNRVVRDDAVLEIAAHPPRSLDDFKHLRGVPRHLKSEKGAESLLAVIERGRSLPADELPKATKSRSQPGSIRPLVELLKVLLKMKCEEHEVAQKLIASVDELEQIAADEKADVRALRGWRREIFGNHALALKRGEIALSARGHKIVLVPLE